MNEEIRNFSDGLRLILVNGHAARMEVQKNIGGPWEPLDYNTAQDYIEIWVDSQKHTREQLREYILQMRNINLEFDKVCSDCDGFGLKLYATTATYHHGIGGAALTVSVCDKCWGSGKEEQPWPSWLKYEQLEKERSTCSACNVCQTCKGTGTVARHNDTWFNDNAERHQVTCDFCEGSGKR